jgi:hypothetical protein
METEQRSKPTKIYLCYVDHDHERIYMENVAHYLDSKGILWRSITLNPDGLRPELQSCLNDDATAVLGTNSQLDHSWLPSGRFLEMAERQGVPVVQWILDHPACRWSEFDASTSTNSRFLLNTEQERQYFETYCLPGALTATTGGVGPNQRSRIEALTPQSFVQRLIACIIPLSLSRVQSIEENNKAINALEPSVADAVRNAIATAQCDLIKPLHSHVIAALSACNRSVSPQTFNSLCQITEQSVQTFRRLKIFATAAKYPVLIQSDRSAISLVKGSAASLATDVSMAVTLSRIPLCRAVLSVSPMSDMIHDRTMNALNAGCVAIAEDNLAIKGLLEHKINALLFRYDDDSLDECLDIVCNQPGRAYEIAQAGMRLRDDPRVRFGQFQNIIELAQRRTSKRSR